MAFKSSVSILQELSMKQKIHYPKYEYEILSPNDKPITFRCKVILGDQHFIGESRSKREAKCEAAKNALKLLGNKTNLDSIYCQSQKVEHNYVGELQELAVKMKVPSPVYTFSNTTDAKTNNIGKFVAMCNFNDLKGCGEGLSKKNAKHLAAKEILEKQKTLHNKSIVPNKINVEEDVQPAKKIKLLTEENLPEDENISSHSFDTPQIDNVSTTISEQTEKINGKYKITIKDNNPCEAIVLNEETGITVHLFGDNFEATNKLVEKYTKSMK